MDVAVIGAGFWGTFIGQALLQRGLEVEWFDGHVPGAASIAAAGLVRPTSWKDPLAPWWRASHEQHCREYFAQHGRELQEHLVSDYNPQPRHQGTLWSCRPPLARATPRVVQRLSGNGGVWTIHFDQGTLTPRHGVVLACGYGCRELLLASQLEAPPLRGLAGRALIGQGAALDGVLTRAFRFAGESRTRKLSIQAWGAGLLRVGDTLEPAGLSLLEPQLVELHKTLALVAPMEGGSWVWGTRPMLPELFVEEIRPGLIVATGGGRRGLAVAPGVGQRVIELWRL